MRLKVAAVFAPLTGVARPPLRSLRGVAQSPAPVVLLLILSQCGLAPCPVSHFEGAS